MTYSILTIIDDVTNVNRLVPVTPDNELELGTLLLRIIDISQQAYGSILVTQHEGERPDGLRYVADSQQQAAYDLIRFIQHTLANEVLPFHERSFFYNTFEIQAANQGDAEFVVDWYDCTQCSDVDTSIDWSFAFEE